MAHPGKNTCERCGGTGKLRYTFLGQDVEPRPFGEGTTIQDMGGSGTRACPCVANLAAIDGKATWWETEVIYSEVVDVPIGQECVEIEADCEVCRAENGRRVHRTAENAYYPPMVKVMGAHDITLHGEDARKLGESLIAAADACDDADGLAAATRQEGGYQA